MKTVRIDQGRQYEAQSCVATIGFFDGVHRGHACLIEQTVMQARRLGLPAVVVTFDRHPRQVLHAEFQPRLLTTLDDKLRLLSETGADVCVVVPFTVGLAQLTARQFMHDVLQEKIGVRRLVIGYDHRFGHNRSEGFEQYVAYGRDMGMDVVRARAMVLNGVHVSSSVIRSFISDGEMRMAAKCLNRPYAIGGRVVQGRHVGRTISFPTANMQPASPGVLLPAAGVYAVRAGVEGHGGMMPAMMNIGTCPTFDGGEQTLEVNIFNFEEDIYGRMMTVEFVKKLRDERKFASVGKLKAQLEQDRLMALEALANK